MLYGVGQAVLAVGALSIGEKKHMEPVRIIIAYVDGESNFEDHTDDRLWSCCN